MQTNKLLSYFSIIPIFLIGLLLYRLNTGNQVSLLDAKTGYMLIFSLLSTAVFYIFTLIGIFIVNKKLEDQDISIVVMVLSMFFAVYGAVFHPYFLLFSLAIALIAYRLLDGDNDFYFNRIIMTMVIVLPIGSLASQGADALYMIGSSLVMTAYLYFVNIKDRFDLTNFWLITGMILTTSLIGHFKADDLIPVIFHIVISAWMITHLINLTLEQWGFSLLSTVVMLFTPLLFFVFFPFSLEVVYTDNKIIYLAFLMKFVSIFL